MNASEILSAIKNGEHAALAKGISRIENQDISFQKCLRDLSWEAQPLIVGITGPPGSGKSLLVGKILEILAPQKRIGVIAVDPTSPITGGALLGDRVRMMDHSNHPNVFIRSMATRGALGGLNQSIQGVIDLFALAGFDMVIVETVGVGQTEIDVVNVADVVVMVQTPISGDDIQVSKAGVFEISNVFVINKSDLGGADLKIKEIRDFFQNTPDPPLIVKTSALQNEGIPELVEAIELSANQTHLKKRVHTLGGQMKKVEHIAIAVENLDEEIEKYQNILGLTYLGTEVVESQKVRLAKFQIGETHLELLEPLSESSPISGFLKKKGPGLHHIAYEVSDIHQTMHDLSQKGLRLIDKDPRPGSDDSLIAFLHPKSMSGVLTELVQKNPT